MAQDAIGFIGAGRMAQALASGLVKAGLADAKRLFASDPSAEARGAFERLSGGSAGGDNAQVAQKAGIVFLAVKPQQMPEVLRDLRPELGRRHLLISIAAGIRLAIIEQGVGDEPRLARVMPNMPCLVGMGASAYCLGNHATPEDGRLVGQLMRSVGTAHEVEEKSLDAVTGLSGSGPAFAFVMIEALADGGVRCGLSREVALALASQTLRGAAEMALAGPEHPAVLKDRVASPGGTTIAGLHALEAGAFRAALISAVEAATRRAGELGT